MALNQRDGNTVVEVRVNGELRSGIAEPRTLLSDFLRHELGLTGTHVGCEQGVCGACTILVHGEPVRSCLTFAVQLDGQSVETVEGMGENGRMDPIQEAYQTEHGLQCGFCTPGFLLSTKALLEHNPDPSVEETQEYLSGNICRCTGYQGIIAAVQKAATTLGEARDDS